MEIWPDNLLTVDVFSAMSTQWRTGYSGATGLDYSVLPVIFKIHRIAQRHWAQIFDGLKIMESAALEVMHAK